VVAAERLTAHSQAAGFSGIGAVAGSYRALDIDDAQIVADGVGFELGSALRWTRRHAETELDLALDLAEQLPSVLRALSEGRIDRQRAKIIVDGTAHLQSVAHARQVADDVDDAGRLTTGQLPGGSGGDVCKPTLTLSAMWWNGPRPNAGSSLGPLRTGRSVSR
jgi:hypothetical protein